MQRLFAPFEKLVVEGLNFLVVDESDAASGKVGYVMFAKLRLDYYLKGDKVSIEVPRMFLFEIGKDEDGEGWDGLQIFRVKLYFDTSLLVGEIEKEGWGMKERLHVGNY
jgi:hypothetical protein